MASRTSALLLLITTAALLQMAARRRQRRRTRLLPPSSERVLILGASSGTGAAIAREYARRGCAAIVLVARRESELHCVRDECLAIASASSSLSSTRTHAPKMLCVAADCTSEEDVVRIRALVLDELSGVDTVHITLGVSALLPLLGIAGVDPVRPGGSIDTAQGQAHASEDGLKAVSTSVARASTANVSSTALLLIALTPVLQLTSRAPAIHILSSLAALFPAPTRALYGATKAAQLILAQGFELETQTQAKESGGKRAKVTFVYLCPGTILSDFRRSAVDITAASSGNNPATNANANVDDAALRRAGVYDSTWDVSSSSASTGRKQAKKSDGLTPERVARRAIALIDAQNGGVHTMKLFELVGRLALVLAPWIPARVAHRKYGY